MSNKFVVEGGIKLGADTELEIGSNSLSAINIANASLSDDDYAKKVVPSEYSVKTYVDSQLGSTDMIFAASANSGNLTGDDLKVDLSGGETFSILGTSNEIETDTDAANQIKIGLPSDVTIGNNLTVSTDADISGTLAAGNTTISGTVSSSGNADFAGTLNVDGTITGDTSLTLDTTTITTAEIGVLDGVTPGTAAASKAMTWASDSSWTANGGTCADLGTVTTVDINGGTIDGSDVTVGSGKTLDVSAGTLTTSTTQDLAILASAASNNNANLDFGAFEVRAQTLEADVADGTAPMTITSTTVVANLNSDKVDGCDVVDEDNMVSDSATSVPTQQSVKAYVDNKVTGSDLDFTTDGGETLNIELETETLTIAGGSNLTSSGSGNEVTIALDATVSGLTSVSSTTLTDGTASMSSGSMTGLVDVTMSGDMTSGTITNAEFTVDASGNTDIDGTLNVEGVPTFQSKSVHSSGIDCNGTLEMEANAIEGTADNMLLFVNDSGSQATEHTFSSEDGVLALQASSHIESLSDIKPNADSTSDLGASDKRWAEVHADKVAMEFCQKQDFSVAMNGSAVEVANLSNFESGKIVLKVKDSSNNITSKEILAINGSFVEYATISSGTEVEMTIAVSGDSVTVNSANGTASGSVDLIK